MIEIIDCFARLFGIGAALRVAFANHLALYNRPLLRNAWLEREWPSVTLAERVNLSLCALAGACAVYPDTFLIAYNVAFNYHFDELLGIVLFHNY